MRHLKIEFRVRPSDLHFSERAAASCGCLTLDPYPDAAKECSNIVASFCWFLEVKRLQALENGNI